MLLCHIINGNWRFLLINISEFIIHIDLMGLYFEWNHVTSNFGKSRQPFSNSRSELMEHGAECSLINLSATPFLQVSHL